MAIFSIPIKQKLQKFSLHLYEIQRTTKPLFHLTFVIFMACNYYTYIDCSIKKFINMIVLLEYIKHFL